MVQIKGSPLYKFVLVHSVVIPHFLLMSLHGFENRTQASSRGVVQVCAEDSVSVLSYE